MLQKYCHDYISSDITCRRRMFSHIPSLETKSLIIFQFHNMFVHMYSLVQFFTEFLLQVTVCMWSQTWINLWSTELTRCGLINMAIDISMVLCSSVRVTLSTHPLVCSTRTRCLYAVWRNLGQWTVWWGDALCSVWKTTVAVSGSFIYKQLQKMKNGIHKKMKKKIFVIFSQTGRLSFVFFLLLRPQKLLVSYHNFWFNCCKVNNA